MKSILVRDVMTRGPITASPETNLLDCAKTMVKKKVSCLLLVEEKKFRGFISDEDILWALVKKGKKDLSEIKASDISPRKIITINPNASINDVVVKMKRTGFERFPVVKNNELAGIITSKDILNFHPELYPELEEFSRIREEADKLKRVESVSEGTCERCGSEDVLHEVDGMLICPSCSRNM